MKTIWTYDDIPDQTGRVAVVTGANSGLGYQTAMMLAKKGAEVVLACRSMEKGETAADSIVAESRMAKLHIEKLDLSDLDSVAACAENLKTKYERIDLLINNAGVMVPPLSRTKQGFELQFGTNHLGHFALTGRLLPLLKDTPGARVVSLSSIAGMMNYIDFNDLNRERKRYKRWPAYCQSKLANQMFIQELGRRFSGHGARAVAAAAHPGISATDLFRTSAFKGMVSRFGQSADKSALPTLRAACGPGVENGSYWGPAGFMEIKGYPAPAKIPSKALNVDLDEKLWKMSEEMTGVAYKF